MNQCLYFTFIYPIRFRKNKALEKTNFVVGVKVLQSKQTIAKL